MDTGVIWVSAEHDMAFLPGIHREDDCVVVWLRDFLDLAGYNDLELSYACRHHEAIKGDSFAHERISIVRLWEGGASGGCCFSSGNIVEQSPLTKKTMTWYSVYCYVNALLYMPVIYKAVSYFRQADSLSMEVFPLDVAGEPIMSGDQIRIVLALLAILFVMFAGVCLWLPTSKRNKTMWVVHVINSALGMGSCLFTPLCIWVLVNLLKPEVRRDFKA